MPRIRLAEQPGYEFHHAVTVESRDINYGGHMGNDALVSLLGTARVHMLHSLGFTELNLGEAHTGILMSDLAVNYRAEGFMFDNLSIDIHIDEFTRTGFRLFYRVTRGETLIALAETGTVTFDHRSRRPAPVPEAFLNAIEMNKEKAKGIHS